MEALKNSIIELLLATKREGMNKLIDELVKIGFFTSPASTKFHGSHEGGLAEHSYNVYTLLNGHIAGVDFAANTSAAKKPLPVDVNTPIIVGLLHDVCKGGAYIATPKGKAPYKWNSDHPQGHAVLSISRIEKFIDLTPIEEMMIRYHMGIYGTYDFYESGSWESGANAEYYIKGNHRGTENMSKEESQKHRYGKSLRNAWYHNPIVKLMSICDELAVIQENG